LLFLVAYALACKRTHMSAPIPGTVVVYGPHYRREGFGALARIWSLALHGAGLNVKVAPVNCDSRDMTGGLDDTDMTLLRRLEATPLVPPVTAIFAYVPIYLWPKLPLPEPNLRIMLTTFDSNVNPAPPQPRYIFICNQMDQIWVVNEAEEHAWIRSGADPRRIHSFKSPHDWIDNPLLPPSMPKPSRSKPFRFLHVSLFLPRRRLEVLVRALFEEFPGSQEAELYLKMTYPGWHPRGPEKAKSDLVALIADARAHTGSRARVIVDNELGTRLGMVRLIDSCDAYVSPDVGCTAPVGEAIIRRRPVIISDDWGLDLPPQAWVVPNTQERVQVTAEMAEYMSHMRGTSFPALDLTCMRKALRHFFELEDEPRRELVEPAYDYLHARYSFAATTGPVIEAIRQGWEDKRRRPVEVLGGAPTQAPPIPKAEGQKTFQISWCGLQLFHGGPSAANREICLELIHRGHQLTLFPGSGPFHVEEIELTQSPKFPVLAARFYEPMAQPAQFNVCGRLLPVFNEQPAVGQILMNNWWASALPVNWVPPIREHVQEVWVPSRFVRENLIRAGVAAHQVQVIPFGFDPAVFRPQASPARLKTKKRFKFLFVGEASHRKGFDRLLLAYLKTFTAQDDVCLVVKDMNCEDYYARRAGLDSVRQCQAIAGCPEIEYLDCMMGEEELAGLYTACDCFVQPFRMAGFGLAILEAMACGLPVITTGYGGPLDFCDDQTAWLLPARDAHHYSHFAGPWRIDSDLLHGKIQLRDLQDRMNHLYRNPEQGVQRANLARERVQAEFTWARTVDRIVGRFEALEQIPITANPRVQPPPSWVVPEAGLTAQAPTNVPTLLIFAPFYNRSGYGVTARSFVLALHALGSRVRIVPVDNVEEGIDDCDLAALKSLEKTPLTLPLVAIFYHVPSSNWLKVQLPPQSVRIMYTTFDSSAQGNLPPADWISVCKQMDQVWLGTSKEASAFAKAGVLESKIRVVQCPHPWVSNPLLPPAGANREGQPFRFLSMAMFQPRRRWDTLVEAFLTEFKDTPNVELYLKVNYPSWHPTPSQPQKDLHGLIEKLRTKTGSLASVILDEALDTRLGICRLIDSCDAYVSTDTAATAPIGEAFTRGKIAVFPDGYGVSWPYGETAFLIPVDQRLSRPMMPEELLYQPHHRGSNMPLLRVEDVRRTLRSAFDLPAAQRQQLGKSTSLIIENSYGRSLVKPMIEAIDACLKEKFAARTQTGLVPGTGHASRRPATKGISPRVRWEGSFLDFGSLSYVNRELSARLAQLPGLRVSLGPKASLPEAVRGLPEFQQLAGQLQSGTAPDTAVTVRHAWPPDWRRPASGKLVVIQPWEFGSLPAEWVTNSRQVDEFWVPSAYVREVYVKSGVPQEKVKVVPNGIDPAKFSPEVQPMDLATRKSFKFLFVGGTIHRKGPDVLLESYLRSFTAQDDVCLVIKDFGGQSFYTGQTMEARIKAAQSQPNAPEILYLNTELPPEALPGLYTACDCLVHPYRGEGFGLPVLEAMACGLPVIVTAGGAADDFATAELTYHIPAQRRAIGREVSGIPLAGEGWLLEPSVEQSSARMRHVFGHREEARAKGQAASQAARRDWTWERAAALAHQHLQTLVADIGAAAAKVSPPPTRSKAAPIVLPPCALIGHLAQGRAHLGNKKYRAAWEFTLAAIQTRPYHPEACLLLAEIALAAGDSTSARRCAQQARDLAPDLKPAKKFLKGNLRGNTRPDWLVLPDSITHQASRITPHASRISVCLIAKNEEKFLAQCLASVRGLADQIVVVDTGSTDRTVAIAKEHGAEVYDFAWCDDFSAARNAALEHATGDWVLMLDADEELPPASHDALRKLLAVPGVMAWRLPIIDVGRENEGCCYVPRLFRNAPALFYIGRVHEQVFTSIEVRRQEWGLDNRLGDAALRHHGYLPEVVKDRNKIERNLRLLEKAIVELPDEPNLLMNYGLELARSGQLEAGIEHYRKAFDLMSAQAPSLVIPETREMLLTQFCTQLTALRRFDEIIRVLTSPLAQSGGLTASLHFDLGLAYLELKQSREAADQMRQCLAKRSQPSLAPINPEIHKAGPHHCLALCLAQLGDTDAAAAEFCLAIEDDPHSRPARFDYARLLAARDQPVEALNLLFELAKQKADDSAVWVLGGQIVLSRPEFLEVALDWTAEASGLFPQDLAILRQRAEVLTLANRCEEALPLWRQLRPESDPALAAALVLCETAANDDQFSPPLHLEAQISREFLKWYQRLIQFNGRPTVEAVNARIDALQSRLPSVAHVLREALAQASVAVAA
jgi:glycosyltransferase involved in cell wall biosynthesis/Tfp pilus assembly protein PilF